MTDERAPETWPAEDHLAGHIVLCGLDRLGLRTLEELRRLDEEVVVIAPAPDRTFAARARQLGAILIQGSYRDEELLLTAAVARARAIVLVEEDDVGNLHAALAAQDLNPNLRIVLRMFNQDLGRRVQTLFRDCSVLIPSAIAAPAFVSAALHQDWEQRIEAAGRTLVLRQGPAGDLDVLLPLADLHGDGSDALFPAGGDDLLYVADGGPSNLPGATGAPDLAPAPARPRLRLGEVAAALRALAADRRVQIPVGILLVLLAASTLVFYLFAGLTLIDAVYFTVTIITTTGFGDINLRDAPPALKLYATSLMLLGAAAMAALYAMVIDAVVGARLAREVHGVHGRMRDHVVVCGLGNVGYRIVEHLVGRGVRVAAAELHEQGRFVPLVRRLGVPVLVADTRFVETLQALHVAQARCLIVATDDEVANVETALNARALSPDVRVVLRLFDPDLAARVERTLGIHISRSVSALAAPAFAAAAVGQRVLATVPVGGQALIVAETRVAPGSWAQGTTIAGLEAATKSRVLLLTLDGRQTWRPSGDTRLTGGEDLVVVATRRGLARVLAGTQAPDAGR